MAAEVTETIEDGALLGPAVAVIAAVPNVMVASVGYATEDSSTNETGDHTADKGAITATAGFSGTSAHGYSCTDRQSGDSGGEGFLGKSVHFHSPISVARGFRDWLAGLRPHLMTENVAGEPTGGCAGAHTTYFCFHATYVIIPYPK